MDIDNGVALTHLHLLIVLTWLARRNGKPLHSDLSHILIHHQLDITILSAVWAECRERIAEGGLKLA